MSLNIPVLVVFRSISRLKDEIDATLEKVKYTGSGYFELFSIIELHDYIKIFDK